MICVAIILVGITLGITIAQVCKYYERKEAKALRKKEKKRLKLLKKKRELERKQWEKQQQQH